MIDACSRGLDQRTHAHVRVRVAHRVVAMAVVVGEVVRAAGEGEDAEVERVGARHVIHDACVWAEVGFTGDAGSVVVVGYGCMVRGGRRLGSAADLPSSCRFVPLGWRLLLCVAAG